MTEILDNETDELIDAAEEYATSYDDDPRECIKADVMNAFYQGHGRAMARAGQQLAELREQLARAEAENERSRALLLATTTALKGEPHPDMLHSWHDLPEWATTLRSLAMLYMAASAPGGTHGDLKRFLAAADAWLAELVGDKQATIENCPRCNKPWADHEFGVPAPYCP